MGTNWSLDSFWEWRCRESYYRAREAGFRGAAPRGRVRSSGSLHPFASSGSPFPRLHPQGDPPPATQDTVVLADSGPVGKGWGWHSWKVFLCWGGQPSSICHHYFLNHELRGHAVAHYANTRNAEGDTVHPSPATRVHFNS